VCEMIENQFSESSLYACLILDETCRQRMLLQPSAPARKKEVNLGVSHVACDYRLLGA
jgi:hypothetical protein